MNDWESTDNSIGKALAVLVVFMFCIWAFWMLG